MMKTSYIIRALYLTFLGVVSVQGYSQVTQIPTGTDADLNDLSVINSSIIISGCYDYLVKSTDDCNNLLPITKPGPAGYITRLQRLDAANLFLLYYKPNQTLLYKSTDGGDNWTQKSNTTGAFSHEIGFFDPNEALMTDNQYLWRTINGGNAWTNATPPFSIGLTALKTFSDSMVCMGGLAIPGASGTFVLSKDRGATWPYGGGFGMQDYVSGFFFLNKDTIFSISIQGDFSRTVNQGQSFTNFHTPLKTAYGVNFRNAKEGYVVGADDKGVGTIAKTNNLGVTWSSFGTGIQTNLMNIAILNDSIALLTGTKGVLIKWNYKNSIFTGIKENNSLKGKLNIFPNPAETAIYIQNDKTPAAVDLILLNSLGQVLYSEISFDTSKPLSIALLPEGLYYVKIQEEGKSPVVCKFIKN